MPGRRQQAGRQKRDAEPAPHGFSSARIGSSVRSRSRAWMGPT
jgi:hypothetical protein